MNEFKQSWICPVCDKEALFENLVIDGYFLNVIKTLGADIHEIQLHKDGSWSKMEEEKQKTQIQDDEGFIISDDDEDEDEINNNTKRNKKSSEKPKVKVQKKEDKVTSQTSSGQSSLGICYPTIDLTLDD
jgi:hypothetical protein